MGRNQERDSWGTGCQTGVLAGADGCGSTRFRYLSSGSPYITQIV